MRVELRLPSIGEYVRHIGRLIAIEVEQPKPPPEPQQDYIFEEIEARCELRLNGEVIKTLQTLNDFYGLETSVKSAIEEMKEYARAKKLTPKSELEVVVIRRVCQYRKRPTNRENFYDNKYVDFAQIKWGAEHNLPNPVETIVWSSKAVEVRI